MKRVTLGLIALLGWMGLAAAASADVKVKLSDVHLCCGACVRDVNAAVKELAGVKLEVDKDGGTVTVNAADASAAQKALDAIAGAGYHGTSDHATLKIKDESGAKTGNVKRVEVSGVHNCCGGCTTAIKDAVQGVKGVKEHTLKNKATTFVVEGEFSASELVKALYDAGFHAKVK